MSTTVERGRSRADASPGPGTPPSRFPAWLLAGIPLVLILGALVALLTVGGNTLGDRLGPPAEALSVERTVLEPGRIDLTVRNTGADAVGVAQISINDQYVDFTATGREIGSKGTEKFTLDYPWIADSPYLVTMISTTGAATEHAIAAAVETPDGGSGFFGLMALLGFYVGVVPVTLGMLFLPFLRQVKAKWIAFFMAVTLGLLGFLALDAYVSGSEIAAASSGAFGGLELLFLGAFASYLVLVGLDRFMSHKRAKAKDAGASAFQLSLLIAIGIGLHNLGEGLAIGSAYAIGELALGAFLVFGFALHNTTEGLAIVAPLAKQSRPSFARLALLGAVAGTPAIIGAFIGASAYNPELATLLLGVGIGAIIQVMVQISPLVKDAAGRVLHPMSVGGILTGVAILYFTGLLVTA